MSAPANREEKKRTHDDYTIGWVVILECELNAARLLLDEEHEGLGQSLTDPNTYLLGRIGEHNVVLASTGVAGTNAAAHMVTNMFRTFRNIRFGLLVGVGGGAPRAPSRQDAGADIRLGDVVVSSPKGRHGGVIQYDMGKWKDPEEFSIESHLNKPPGMLLSAVPILQSDQSTGRGKMNEYIRQVVSKASGLPKLRKSYQFHGWGNDKLFKASYPHPAGHEDDCAGCDGSMTEERLARESDEPAVHYGLIASANAVMRCAMLRDKLRDVWGVSCFEMEAAGLMDSFPCLVIRGICDYSDSHKNKIWQPYAAIAAAAYAKDLLRIIKAADVKTVPPAVDTVVPPPPVGQHEAPDGGVHRSTKCRVGHATLPAIDKILASPEREAFIADLVRVGRVIIGDGDTGGGVGQSRAALEGFTHRWDINFRWWGSGSLYYNGMSQGAGRAKWMDRSAPLAARFRGWEAEIGCWLNGKWWMTYYDVARFMADLLEYVGVKDV